jgi:hypothetical protein
MIFHIYLPEYYQTLYNADKKLYDILIGIVNKRYNNIMNNLTNYLKYFNKIIQIVEKIKNNNGIIPESYGTGTSVRSRPVVTFGSDDIRIFGESYGSVGTNGQEYGSVGTNGQEYGSVGTYGQEYGSVGTYGQEYGSVGTYGQEYGSVGSYGESYGTAGPYKKIILNPQIKTLIENMQFNYNPYNKKNTLYEKVYNKLWDKTIKNLTEDDKKIDLFVTPENYIDKIRLNTSNIENYYRTTQTGGYNQYDILGIKLNTIKSLSVDRQNVTKYITTSLFDAYLGDVANQNKNINHYAICLYESIKLYQKLLPDYNIRIYGDLSINIANNNNENLVKLFELIEASNNVEYMEVEQNFNEISGLHKNKKKYVGLLGAFYRYYILLDPIVENCVIVDADNFPTEIFTNIIRDWENNAENNLLIFKPLYYARKNLNNDCIQQMLAGMSGFKKPSNMIINPLIFKKMFDLMDLQYDKFKNDFIDDCDNNKKIKYTTPFAFGFEEQALSNILIPYFLIKNEKIVVVPLYFDFGASFVFYYNNIFDLLTKGGKELITNKLGLTYNNFQLLTYVDPLYGFNIHLSTILVNFLDRCIKNNNFNINGVSIVDSSNIDALKTALSIKGFYHIYPSFNILMPIDKIFEYVDELYNGTNKLPNIVPSELPLDAKKEFGNLTNAYDTYINTDKDIKKMIEYDSVLNILKSSNLYKNKYLKYKQKYLELKNKSN